VTNRTLPPTQEFPEAGASTGIFVGDYMGVAVGSDGVAHPVWTDTRNPIFSPSTGGDVRELVRRVRAPTSTPDRFPGSPGEPSILAHYVRSVKPVLLRTEMP
jgi:hypothetical protein